MSIRERLPPTFSKWLFQNYFISIPIDWRAILFCRAKDLSFLIFHIETLIASIEKKFNLHSCQDFCLRSDRFCVQIPRFAFFIFRARKYFTHLFKFHDFLRSPTYSLYKAYNSELYTIWGKVNKTITFSLNPKTILIRIKGYWYKMKRVLWEYFPKVFPGHVSCDKWSWSFWFWGFSNFCRACWPKLFCPSQKKVTNEAF